MRKIITPDQMRALEKRYMEESATPSRLLMERAARGVALYLDEALGCKGQTVAFACGPGNNGGDGFAAARLHAEAGGKSIVLAPSEPGAPEGDAKENCLLARKTENVEFLDLGEMDLMPRPAAWVDALFGIGRIRPLEGAYARLIGRMERDRLRGAKIVSVDIPSGIDALTGRAVGEAVRATHTLSFEAPKPGHLLADGLEHAGKLITIPLGIPGRLWPEKCLKQVEKEDLARRLRPRPRNSYKGSYGHLLIVAGSAGMAGAAVLCTLSALRSGAGLVTVACPASVAPILQIACPGAICAALPESGGAIAPEALEALSRAMEGKTAIAVGPGLSRRACPEAVEAALRSNLPSVMDADALNLLAAREDLLRLLGPSQLITPHPGEAARLLGRESMNPIEDARALRGLGPTVVLKGSATVVFGREQHLSAFGTSGMAKGGSGDVLTGLAGGLLAQGYDTETAAWMACAIHGLAGERAEERFGRTAMNARDLIDCIPEVLREAEANE